MDVDYDYCIQFEIRIFTRMDGTFWVRLSQGGGGGRGWPNFRAPLIEGAVGGG